MRRPSVIFFNRVYPPVRGATGRVLRDLARGFARDGWDVTVVTTGTQTRNERDGAVRIVRLRAPQRSKSMITYGLIWLKLFWTGLFLPPHDLIVTMTDPPMLVVAGRLLRRIKKSRHVHWCQDLYPDLLPSLGINLPPAVMDFFRLTARRSMKSCDKVVTIGRCMARYLVHGGMDPGRIAVIPNWPEYELLAANERQVPSQNNKLPLHGRARRKFSTVSGAKPYDQLFRDDKGPKFRILYSGNIGRAHPLQTVLQAAELINRKFPEIEFVFVGDGPNFDRLAQERARRGLENIRLLPWQPASRLRELMESGDLHLVTMRDDAAGKLVPCKLYAALAVERPCILVGPQDSEAARIIRDFKAGSVVPHGDPLRLARTIVAYRKDSEAWFAAQKGAAAAGRIFVPDESIRAWIDRARAIVQPGSRRRIA